MALLWHLAGYSDSSSAWPQCQFSIVVRFQFWCSAAYDVADAHISVRVIRCEATRFRKGGPWLTILELFRRARSSQVSRTLESSRCSDSYEEHKRRSDCTNPLRDGFFRRDSQVIHERQIARLHVFVVAVLAHPVIVLVSISKVAVVNVFPAELAMLVVPSTRHELGRRTRN
jgi:hypothetical protein